MPQSKSLKNELNIYLLGEWAFCDIGSGYMLAICTKAELDTCTDKEVVDKVCEAIAYSQYRSISDTKGLTLQ